MRDTIWRAAQERLRGELPEKDYETWIAPLRAAGWSDRTLTLETPSGFFRDWLRGRFLGVLEDAASGASGEPASPGTGPVAPAAPRRAPAGPLLLREFRRGGQ